MSRGIIAQWLEFLLRTQLPWVRFPKKFLEEKNVDVAKVYQWFCSEESGLWLEIVDQTPLVLTSDKLVPPKKFESFLQQLPE